MGSATVNFGPEGTDDTPAVQVGDGTTATTLNFTMKDLSGWTTVSSSTDYTDAMGKTVVRVANGSTLNIEQSGSDTAYFANRLVLDNGSTVNINVGVDGYSLSAFRLVGGPRTEDLAQIAMLDASADSPTSATIGGTGAIRFHTDSTVGASIAVGDNATLTISNDINSASGVTGQIHKLGGGTLILSGANTAVNPFVLSEGTLTISGAGTLGSGTLTLSENTILSVTGTTSSLAPTNTITGAGNVVVGEGGSLDISGTTLTDFTGAIAVNAGTLTIGSLRPTLSAIGDTVTIAIVASSEELTAASISIPVTTAVTAAPEAARFAVTSDGATVNVTGVTLDSEAGTLTVALENTYTIDFSSASFPLTMEAADLTKTIVVSNSVAPSHALAIFKATQLFDVATLPTVEGADWSVSETADSDGYYTYTLTPNVTTAPDSTFSMVFDGSLATTGASISWGENSAASYGLSVPGKSQALTFVSANGTPYTDSMISISGSWTISFFAFPVTSAVGDRVVFFNLGGKTSPTLSWNRTSSDDPSTGAFAFYPSAADLTTVVTTDTVKANEWHHVTVTYDALSKTVYLAVDDLTEKTLAVSTAPDGATGFQIGNVYTNSGNFSKGTGCSIDELQIWNSALNTAQIATITSGFAGIYALYVEGTQALTTSSTATQLFTSTTTTLASATTENIVLLSVSDSASTLTVDAGVATTNLQGYFTGELTLAHPTDGTATLASLELLNSGATVVFNESQDNYVTTRNGTVGTYKFKGGTADSPLVVTFTGTEADTAYGAYAIAADSYLNIYNEGSNKLYNVTGEGASSVLILTSASNWGTEQDSTSFADLTLQIPSDGVNFWIRPGSTSGVILDIGSGRTVHIEPAITDSGATALELAGLTGSGTLTGSYGLTLSLTGDYEFSGSLSSITAYTIAAADGVTSPTFTYSGSSALSSAITLSATLNLAPASEVTVSGAITGAGTVAASSGTVTLSAANGNHSGPVSISEGATLIASGSNSTSLGGSGTVTTVNGTLQVQGGGSNWGTITGTGDVIVAGDYALHTNALATTGTLTVNDSVTLTLDGIAVNGPSVVLNGTITGGTITIPADKTLSGTGSTSATVTFADGATLDITGNTTTTGLTFSAATEPTIEGTLTVSASSTAEAGTVIYLTGAAGSTAAQYMDVTGTSLFATPASNGYVLIAGSSITINSLPEDATGSGETISDTALAELQEIAANDGMTTVTFSGEVMGNTITLQQLNGAIECFDNIISANASEGTIDVSYDFGISSIKPVVAEDGTVTLVVTATVLRGDGTAAAYAEGTSVVLTVGTESSSVTPDADSNTVTWTIDVPESGTDLSVKVTTETTESAAE